MIRRRIAIIVVVLLAYCMSAQDGRADQPPQIVTAAKSEGTVIWYSSVDTATLNTLVGLFNDSHPGITVKALQIGSNLIPAKVMTERAAGKYNADVVTCDQFAFSQLTESDVFQPFQVAGPGNYLKGTLDPKGYWAAFFTDTTVIAWNPDRLKADGLKPPASLADLTKPEWKGKLGMDGSAFNWYQGMLATQKNAQQMLKKIADNKPLVTSGHSATITQLVDGEYDATPTAYGYMAERARLAGRPIEFLSPNPVPVGLELVAILKNAPHPNAARVFVDWLLSKRAQQFFADDGRTPTRTDIKSDLRVFNAKMPFYVMPAPVRSEYNDLVSGYKTLLGIAD
jgi:iron(III) transport system substrate-binding protein